MSRKLIYVCSPYSGNIDENIVNARIYSRFVVKLNHIPITPHLLFPQFISEHKERDLAMELNLDLLKNCHEIWAFGDRISAGMRYELEYARENNIPIKEISIVRVNDVVSGILMESGYYELRESLYGDFDKFISEEDKKVQSTLDEVERVLDDINHPKHYTHGIYEPKNVIRDWNLNFSLGNVIKYIARADHKGNKIKDLEKARFYLNDEIEHLREKEGDKYYEEID